MTLSVFDLFTIGIGPSSSHTVGPMRAALAFVERLEVRGSLDAVARVKSELFGSLGLTGRGHGSDRAVQLGLLGEAPESVDPDTVDERLADIAERRRIALLGRHEIDFVLRRDLVLHRRRSLPFHPNGMRMTAFDADGNELDQETYYSIGGGFVLTEDDAAPDASLTAEVELPYDFRTGAELLELCRRDGKSIAGIMLANECVRRPPSEVRDGLLEIWEAMRACVARGCRREGVLPGGLNVRRRAPALHRSLLAMSDEEAQDPLHAMDWVNLWALAVNEENAAQGRVVTAPTNGAAGIVPAVLHYYDRFHGPDPDAVVRFLLTAGAIGYLFKENASISGAEVGCQGEVGVACAMAAAGLAEVLGGTPLQVENAAEIGMEHNLGLTCDPVGGLVQIPCIERNAMGSVKAINAARMALVGDGTHHITLDRVIRTMRRTGADMKRKYKETSRGGLAVNLPEC